MNANTRELIRGYESQPTYLRAVYLLPLCQALCAEKDDQSAGNIDPAELHPRSIDPLFFIK